MLSALILLMLFVSACQPVSADKPYVDSFTLKNGIHVVLVHLAGSKNVSIFTFLPMGLASDGPGQAQWSHLVEHMVIRSTVPYGSQHGNAETMHDNMRLDFYGTVDNWQEGLSHHVRWLEGVPFTEQNLQAEKVRVNNECYFPVRNLATHKLAFAAWAQGYRHGRTHAAIKGDILRAELGEIQRYRNDHLAFLNKAVVCIVGGIGANTVLPVITQRLEKIQSTAKPIKPAQVHAGHHNMTWDIDARHLVLTWPIPRFTEKDYPPLMVAAQLLMMQFFSDSELKTMTGSILTGADLTVPEGNFFYVSASLRPEASFDEVRENLIRHVQALQSNQVGLPKPSMIGRQLSHALTSPMDPAMIKAQAPQGVSLAMIEGNVGLQWGMQEFRYGKHRSALAKHLAAISAKQVSNAANAYLTDEKCTICSIQPKPNAKKSVPTKQ